MSEKKRPIICLDFDGVVHDYLKGWQDGSIYGSVTPGFFEWAQGAIDHFTLVIYSSRSKTDEGIDAMRHWIGRQADLWAGQDPDKPDFTDVLGWFEFAHEKPPAFLTIDDRAVTFGGDWSAGYIQPKDLLQYKTWSQK